MNRLLAVGLGVTGIGTVAYVVGVAAPYPGRAFSVTLVMIGVTLAAIGSGSGST